MINIRKKIVAIAVLSAMAVSMAACSDKPDDKSSSANNNVAITAATLTSEEAEKLKKIDFTVAEFIPPTEGDGQGLIGQDPIEQDPVENSQEGGNSSADNNNSNNNNNNSQQGTSAGQQGVESDILDDPTGFIVIPGNEDSGSGNNNQQSGNSNNSSGTKKIYQTYWMNLNGDFIFDGEFLTAEFKIKETTPNGTYPVTIEWLDFANIQAVSLKATGIDGAVVVGGTAQDTPFKNDGSFEVRADTVSGKPGDIVKVSIRFNNNPGICADVVRFVYDSDALEIVKEKDADGNEREKVEPGVDFVNALETQNT